jgi:hypothetical protein
MQEWAEEFKQNRENSVSEEKVLTNEKLFFNFRRTILCDYIDGC